MDYNLYWPSKTIAAFLPVLAESLRAGGQQQIALMPCETAGWDGLAEAQGDRIAATLMADSVALKHIGLLGGLNFAGTDLRVAAFARNGAAHPDALVVINLGETAHAVEVTVNGTAATRFRAHRTSGDASAEAFKEVGTVECGTDGRLRYTSAPKAVTTFFGLRSRGCSAIRSEPPASETIARRRCG